MKIFVDYIGHADLYYSMYLLLEKRLGATLYRPLPTAEFNNRGILTSTLPNEVGFINQLDGVHHIPMLTHGYSQKAIDWERFQDEQFDFIITTFHGNEGPFATLARQKKSTFIRQIANIHERPAVCKNILLSTITEMPRGCNSIQYHPEHHADYSFAPPACNQTINSFYNNMTTYASEVDCWRQAKNALPDFTFSMHGHENEDGPIPQAEMPDTMKNSMFIWHTKPNGCGGYVARQALACGRPLIVRKDYAYAQKTLAYNYLVDGVNCIDISPKRRSLQESFQILRAWSRPDVYAQKCEDVRNHFSQHINFDREAEQIRSWLTSL